MPKGSLPGYVWDKRLHGGGYRRVLADGRLSAPVPQAEIVAGLRQIAARSETMFGDLAVAVWRGELTANDAILAGTTLLKDLYNAYAALARGGWSNMDYAAWGRNGQLLRVEYPYWRAFMQEIAGDQPFTERQLRARAALYAGRAYSRYFAEDRLLKLQAGDLTRERWEDTGDEAECGDCAELAALGWVPLGTLGTVPGAGATQCLGACRCTIAYQ